MHVGQLGLPGVVGDLAVDAASRAAGRRSRSALISAWPRTCVALDEADAAGEHLLAGLARRHVDADVVVARLGAPGRGRVVGGERVDRHRAVGQLLDRRRDLADERDARALGRPQPQRDVAAWPCPSRSRIIARKSSAMSAGSAMMSTRAEQRRGDPAQLAHLPVGADAAAVALEPPLARSASTASSSSRRLVLVLAVGQQDRVADAAGRGPEQLAGEPEPRSDRGAAAGLQPGDRLLGRASRLRPMPARAIRPAGTRRRAASVPAITPNSDAVADAVDRHAAWPRARP